MLKLKKLAAPALAFALAITLAACSGEQMEQTKDDITDKANDMVNDIQGENTVQKLGTSKYAVTLSPDYSTWNIDDMDFADNMVDSYYSNDKKLGFCVYQFSKDDSSQTLAEYVEGEAVKHSAADTVTDAQINGIPVGYYHSTEENEGKTYDAITYIIENGDSEYIKIVFRLEDEGLKEEAEKIINSLEIREQ